MQDGAAALPTWECGIGRWAERYIRRNLWRVQSISSFEDLGADARLRDEICKKTYTSVTEPAHFMALFKTALTNHINLLSRQAALEVREADLPQVNEDGEPYVAYHDLLGHHDYNAGMLKIMLSEAPPEVKLLLQVLCDDDHLDKLRTEHASHKSGVRSLQRGGLYVRETTNEWYCRLLGLDPNAHDIVSMVRRYLGQEYD